MITATVKTASNFFLREYSASVFSAFTHLFTTDMPLMGNLIILQLTSSPHDWLDVNGMMLEERKRINFFLNFSIQQNSRRFSHYSFTPSFEHQSHRKRSFHLLPELTLPREENRSWLGCYGSRAGPSFSYITTSSSIDSSQEWMCVVIFQSDSVICGNWTSTSLGSLCSSILN